MHCWSFNAYRSGFFRLLLIITLISFHSSFILPGRCHFIQTCCLIQCWPCVFWPALLFTLLFMRTIILLTLAAMDNKMETFWLMPPFWCSHITALPYWHKENKRVWLSVVSGRFISSNNHVSLSQEGAHHAALIAEIVLNMRSRKSILTVHSFTY